MRHLLRRYFKYMYDSVTKGYVKALFRLFEKNANAVLVDAGCWDGRNTVEYGKSVGTHKLIGLEVVQSAAKKANERSVRVVIADLNRKIPLKSDTADVVVANHVIEHLYIVDAFVEELYRILKPGGYLVLGTPNLASWHNVFALFVGRQPYSGPTVQLHATAAAANPATMDADISSQLRKEKNLRLLSEVENKAEAESALGHIVVLTYKTLIRLLSSKGFVIEESRGFGYHPFPPVIAKALAKIDKAHSHYVLVKARKPPTGKSL